MSYQPWGICSTCKKEGYLYSKNSGLCKPCYSAKKQAERRASEPQVEYRKRRKEYMAIHPVCEHPGCDQPATELHHMRGRIGSLLTDPRWYRALCNRHHREVETHPEDAKKLGLSASRLAENQ